MCPGLTVAVVPLGCDKNTVDGEYLAGFLTETGAKIVGMAPDETARSENLDAVIILTCGFIDEAERQSTDTIAQWLEARRQSKGRLVVAVAGCLTQEQAQPIRSRFAGLDLIAGVGRFEELASAVLATVRSRREDPTRLHKTAVLPPGPPDSRITTPTPRAPLETSATAYLKIADGCDYACAFCVIPRMKGPYQSVRSDILVEEARGLVARGSREIVLVAQDISAYGRDLGEDTNLTDLIRRICAIEGGFWVRLMYFYPGGFSDGLIETMFAEPKVCPYLDVPLQHLDPGIVAAMKRPYSDTRVMEWVGRLRARIPDVALRTTFVVGFPGEGKKQFMRLLNGLRDLQFDNAGFFPFCPQEGASAAAMEGQVGDGTKRKRLDRLMRRQRQIAERRAARFVGRRLETLVDGRFAGTDLYVGHTRYQAPEVDGMTRFGSAKALSVGEFVEVEIESVDGYDLVGRAV